MLLSNPEGIRSKNIKIAPFHKSQPIIISSELAYISRKKDLIRQAEEESFPGSKDHWRRTICPPTNRFSIQSPPRSIACMLSPRLDSITFVFQEDRGHFTGTNTMRSGKSQRSIVKSITAQFAST